MRIPCRSRAEEPVKVVPEAALEVVTTMVVALPIQTKMPARQYLPAALVAAVRGAWRFRERATLVCTFRAACSPRDSTWSATTIASYDRRRVATAACRARREFDGTLSTCE